MTSNTTNWQPFLLLHEALGQNINRSDFRRILLLISTLDIIPLSDIVVFGMLVLQCITHEQTIFNGWLLILISTFFTIYNLKFERIE